MKKTNGTMKSRNSAVPGRKKAAKRATTTAAKSTIKAGAPTPSSSGSAPGRRKEPPVAPPNRSAASAAKATIRQLRTRLAQALKRIDELQASADTDFLLDIHNRRGFERELVRSIDYIQRYHASGALIVLDVDRLKPINDTYGHAAGDQVLKAIVAALRSHVRSSDVLGRLGGDEFALLLWNLSETDAQAKAMLLEEAVDQMSFVFRGHKVSAGVSTGVVLLGAHAEAGKALEAADSAMYVRKAQRRHET